MQKLLKNISEENIRAYIIWLPILKVDSRELAMRRTKLCTDKRVTYFWDGRGITGKAWQKVLYLQGTAWAVYMLYDAAHTSWTKVPDAPVYWMHQLRAAKELAPFLDAPILELKIKELFKQSHKL